MACDFGGLTQSFFGHLRKSPANTPEGDRTIRVHRPKVKLQEADGPKYRERTEESEPKQTCSKCRKEKPLSSFHRNKKRESGSNPQCKECSLENQRKTNGVEHPDSKKSLKEKFSFWKLKVGEEVIEYTNPKEGNYRHGTDLGRSIRIYERQKGKQFTKKLKRINDDPHGRRIGFTVRRIK